MHLIMMFDHYGNVKQQPIIAIQTMINVTNYAYKYSKSLFHYLWAVPQGMSFEPPIYVAQYVI